MAHGLVATERPFVWENFGEGRRWVLNRRETLSDFHLHGFSGYCVGNRVGAKGSSKPSKDIYWLVGVVSFVFGLKYYIKGGQDWQSSQNELHIFQRCQGPEQTVLGQPGYGGHASENALVPLRMGLGPAGCTCCVLWRPCHLSNILRLAKETASPR